MANEFRNDNHIMFPEPTTVGKNRKGEKPTEAKQKGAEKTKEADATDHTHPAQAAALQAQPTTGIAGPSQIHRKAAMYPEEQSHSTPKKKNE